MRFPRERGFHAKFAEKRHAEDAEKPMRVFIKWKAVLIPLAALALIECRLFAADSKDALFLEGNKSYQNGQYEEALGAYQKILETGFESGPLYYNMGNCCYKLSRIGQSILFYERARKSISSDEDLKTNLTMANLAVVDKIEPQPEFILFKIVRAAVHLIPKQILVILLIASYLLAVGLFILWMLARKSFARLLGLRGAAVFGIFCAVFGILLIGQVRENATRREAVILTGKVEVMSGPGGQTGTEVFSLHEGTKVMLDRESGEWIEIILPDRKVGWVKKVMLGII
jgi:tetratricopeptide (TPR) repeat protein